MHSLMSVAPEYYGLLIFRTVGLTSSKTGIRMKDILSKGNVGLQPSINGKIRTALNG